jgi:hypothetical protein
MLQYIIVKNRLEATWTGYSLHLIWATTQEFISVYWIKPKKALDRIFGVAAEIKQGSSRIHTANASLFRELVDILSCDFRVIST